MLHAAAQHLLSARRRDRRDRSARSSCTCVFDYRTLPFITSQNPYFEVFRRRTERRRGRGRPAAKSTSPSTAGVSAPSTRPAASPGRSTTSCSRRIYDPRATAVLDRRSRTGDARYHVYFSNDRAFIYAIGYPALDALRSSRASRGADDARRRRLRARAARHRDVHPRSRARGRGSAARCCARSARASTASCSSRSCSRRSSRC